MRLESDFRGNLRRILTCVASNVVSQRRRSIQALLTLASPSAQVVRLCFFVLSHVPALDFGNSK
jgi:hypothetical protein